MAKVGQRDTDIERVLGTALWRVGVRYRKNVKLVGTPDLAIPKSRVLIFVDSCFWHGCRYHCRHPKSNSVFWDQKIERNRRRDLRVSRYHRRRGWKVLRFWEHRLRADLKGCVQIVLEALAEAPSGRSGKSRARN